MKNLILSLIILFLLASPPFSKVAFAVTEKEYDGLLQKIKVERNELAGATKTLSEKQLRLETLLKTVQKKSAEPQNPKIEAEISNLKGSIQKIEGLIREKKGLISNLQKNGEVMKKELVGQKPPPPSQGAIASKPVLIDEPKSEIIIEGRDPLKRVLAGRRKLPPHPDAAVVRKSSTIQVMERVDDPQIPKADRKK